MARVLAGFLRDILGEALVRLGEWVRGPFPGPDIDELEDADGMLGGGEPTASGLTAAGEQMRGEAVAARARAVTEPPKVLEGSRQARMAAARSRASR